MFLSALKVALALFLVLKRFSNLHESIEEEKEEKSKNNLVKARKFFK